LAKANARFYYSYFAVKERRPSLRRMFLSNCFGADPLFYARMRLNPKENNSVQRGQFSMKPALIPPPNSICRSTGRSDVLPPEGAAPSIRRWVGRKAERCFRGVRFIFSGLLDNSAFQEVSLAREVSVVFTANAPLVYRCRANNATDGPATPIAPPKVSPERRIASIIRICGRFGRYFSVSGLCELFMKPKSKASEPLRSATKPVFFVCGQRSAIEWKVSGKAMSIDEFIEHQAEHVNSSDLRLLNNFSGRLLDKLKEPNPDEYPGMHEAVYTIVRCLEGAVSLQVKDPLPRWLAETGVAASYFLKRFDLIPDHLPEIGLSDDSLVLQRVIERNQDLFGDGIKPHRK
jgi:hypothetical protein